jgi:hypothetical protein
MNRIALVVWFGILLLCTPRAVPHSGAEEARPAPNFVRADGTFDLDAAVTYFEELYRSDSSISTAELVVVRPRRKRRLTMKVWTEGEEKALVIISDPPREKGTATLKVDDNLWNYLPRIRRTIRIPPSMMLTSWMGSDFTNDDLVRESSYSKDYTYELAGRSTEPDGWIIRFTAKANVVSLWKRFELVVSPEGTIPLQSRWYNRKDELAREITWSDIKVLDGKRLPTRMTLVPTDKDDEGHATILVYHAIDFGAQLPPNTFSLSRLEQKR